MADYNDLSERIAYLEGLIPATLLKRPKPLFEPGYKIPSPAMSIEYSGPELEDTLVFPSDWDEVEILMIRTTAVVHDTNGLRIVHWLVTVKYSDARIFHYANSGYNTEGVIKCVAYSSFSVGLFCQKGRRQKTFWMGARMLGVGHRPTVR